MSKPVVTEVVPSSLALNNKPKLELKSFALSESNTDFSKGVTCASICVIAKNILKKIE